MMGREGCVGLRWVALLCLLVVCKESAAEDFNESAKPPGSCEAVCRNAGVQNGCQKPPMEDTSEEVIVVADKGTNVGTWDFDTIHMVISRAFDGAKFGLPACVAHSKGKRFGLREAVNYNSTRQKDDFIKKLKNNYQLLQADSMVFDLLDLFHQLDTMSNNKSAVISRMASLLADTNTALKAAGMTEAYCVLPWIPPNDDRDAFISLLKNCDVLMLSPDSYNPKAKDEDCVAQATIPIPKFLYGLERYISLQTRLFMSKSIVAGIPWHGYIYQCESQVGAKCNVKDPTGSGKKIGNCFDESNRERKSLGQIYTMTNLKSVSMDHINQAIFTTLDDNSQLWYENLTTLYLKYQLVKDLGLRGLSIWYGDDMEYGSVSKNLFAGKSWDFLTHHVLHKNVFHPTQPSHYYADTVAGVGVGCLLLGTALGVTFACIAFRRNALARPNRPFKLDEDQDDFRDDEGL